MRAKAEKAFDTVADIKAVSKRLGHSTIQTLITFL